MLYHYTQRRILTPRRSISVSKPEHLPSNLGRDSGGLTYDCADSRSAWHVLKRVLISVSTAVSLGYKDP